MKAVRDVSSAEATAFLRQQDKMAVFKTGTVGFYLVISALQTALATAPGARQRNATESVREVSTAEAAKMLRAHDKLKVLKTGQIGFDTAVSIMQAALAYTSAPGKPAKSTGAKAPAG